MPNPYFSGALYLWVVTAVLLLFSFALLYRFGPNLKDRRRWKWSIPGAAVAERYGCFPRCCF